MLLIMKIKIVVLLYSIIICFVLLLLRLDSSELNLLNVNIMKISVIKQEYSIKNNNLKKSLKFLIFY